MSVPSDAPQSIDAIVVIPGLMGSVLREADSGEVLWGFDRPGLYVDAWTSGRSLDRLAVTPGELEGVLGRVVPERVLDFAAFSPLLQGFEPYGGLVRRLESVVRDPSALMAFAYDWRLSIAHNARMLERAASEHLDRWQNHPRGSADARLVLVAHSMGGLIARYFTRVLGGNELCRLTITVGTPYYGSVQAALMMANGQGAPAPLPRRRLRRMARTMPGLYDLLPTYACVEESTGTRRLSPSDVSAFGGDRYLARDASDRHDALALAEVADATVLIAGIGQPTPQSLILSAGTASPRFSLRSDDIKGGQAEADYRGDGTVFRLAAAAFGAPITTVTQTHGALARKPEVINQVCDTLTIGRSGPPLGGGAVAIGVQDLTTVGHPVSISLGSAEAGRVGVTVDNVQTNRRVATPRPLVVDGDLTAVVTFREPGVYRVSAKAGGVSPVTQQIMVLDVAPALGDKE